MELFKKEIEQINKTLEEIVYKEAISKMQQDHINCVSELNKILPDDRKIDPFAPWSTSLDDKHMLDLDFDYQIDDLTKVPKIIIDFYSTKF